MIDPGTITLLDDSKKFTLKLKRNDTKEEAFKLFNIDLYNEFVRQEHQRYFIKSSEKNISEWNYIKEITLECRNSNISDETFNNEKTEMHLPELLELLFRDLKSADIQVISFDSRYNLKIWARKN